MLLMTLAIVTHCKKEGPDGLAPANQDSSLALGCLVDGEVFVPRTGGISCGGIKYQYGFGRNGPRFPELFSLFGENCRTRNSIFLQADSVVFEEGKTYPIVSWTGGSSGKVNGAFSGSSRNVRGLFEVKDSNPGILMITKCDSAVGILSGRFSFTGEDGNGNKVVVTDGRFNLRFKF